MLPPPLLASSPFKCKLTTKGSSTGLILTEALGEGNGQREGDEEISERTTLESV